MKPEMKASIVETVKRFPDVTFIWKYEVEDDIGKGVPNLVKRTWTPQTDLLREFHQCTKRVTVSGRLSVFLSHGGMASTIESAYSPTPVLAIGLFFDQMRNAAMLARHGGALMLLPKDLFSPDSLEWALREILDNPR